jgi:phosphatidylglycerophosphatase A
VGIFKTVEKTIQALPIKNPIARFFILGISSGFGLGYLPKAPGTFGSLLGIPFGLLLLQLPPWAAALIVVTLTLLSTPLVYRAGQAWGKVDCQRIVWDEVIGQGIAILGLRRSLSMSEWWSSRGQEFQVPDFTMLAVAFVAFRAFDILKPFPARTFDEQDSGFGVMMDDVVAGLYAALLVWILNRITSPI